MPTTEMVSLPLKAGLNPGQPGDASAKVLHETCVSLSETNGCKVVRFGTAIEDGSVLRVLIDWDSLDKHKEFMASDRYPAFSENIKSVLAGPPKIQHVDFRPTDAHDKVFSAPVSEIVNIYFDGKVPGDYNAAMDALAKAAQGQPGFHALSWGDTYETLEHDGVKGQAAAVTLGWDSVDAHMKFRETQAFKDAVPGLRSVSKASETQHVQSPPRVNEPEDSNAWHGTVDHRDESVAIVEKMSTQDTDRCGAYFTETDLEVEPASAKYLKHSMIPAE